MPKQSHVNLGHDNWTVHVKIEPTNGYWTANPIGIGTVTIALGSTKRRVTGGGWVPDNQSVNDKSNFGFTVNHQKTGSLKGNSIYLFHGTDGFNYLVKSNSWQGGGLSLTGLTKPTSAASALSRRLTEPRVWL